jgi:hypothetical protein
MFKVANLVKNLGFTQFYTGTIVLSLSKGSIIAEVKIKLKHI